MATINAGRFAGGRFGAGRFSGRAGGGAIAWTVRQGTTFQTLDVTGEFAPGANFWSTSEPDVFQIEAGIITVDTDYLSTGELSVEVTGGAVTKTLNVTVQEFEPVAMFAANPTWVGGFIDPSDTSTLFSDVAGTVPITGNGDTVRSYRIGSTLFAAPAVTGLSSRAYTDNGVAPPRMSAGILESTTNVTVGPNLFVCSGNRLGSSAGNSRLAFANSQTNFVSETTLGLSPSGTDLTAVIRTTGGTRIGNTATNFNFDHLNDWLAVGMRVVGTDLTIACSGARQSFVLASPIETVSKKMYLGGWNRNNVENSVAAGSAAAVYIWNAAPSDGAWLLIERWVADRTADASAFATFTLAPSITPTDATFNDTLTVNKGLAFGSESIDPTAQYLLDGSDVTGDVVGGEYDIPASDAHQFVQVSTAGVDGYSPDTVVVTHVEIDQGTTPSGEDNAPTVSVTKYAHDGVLFTFGAAVPVGHYISGPGAGDIFIVDPGAGVTVTYSPGPALTTDTIPRQINGAVLNPACDGKSGYDSRSGQYLAANNASLGTITMSAGDSLVVSLSNPEWVGPKDNFISQRFVVLTCVSAAPKWDAFRPPYTWPASAGGKPAYRMSQIDLADLPSLASVAGAPSAASVAEISRRPMIDTEPNFLRDYLTTIDNGNRYGREHISGLAPLVAFLLSDAPQADKRQPTINLVQSGIDLLGVFLDGQDRDVPEVFAGSGSGGHNNGREFQLTVAGWLLGDAAFQSAIASHPVALQEKAMTFYVTQEVVDVTNGGGWVPEYPANGSAPYQQGMFDGGFPMPEWRGQTAVATHNAHFSAHPYRIGGQNADNPGQMIQALFLLAAGLKPTWNHDAFFDYQVRHWQIRSTGVDPWILQGGTTPLYTLEGVSTTGFTGWPYAMFAEHIFDHYSYPWEA